MKQQSANLAVSGVNIRLRRRGNGPVMLFLHGAGGLLEDPPIFGQFETAHELLAPDHPAFGASDDANWLRSVADLGMFYLELLEQLDLAGVHIVGHSLGGWIAAEMAIRDRSRIASLTLLSPAGLRVRGEPMGDPFIWAPDELIRNLYFDQELANRQLAQEPDEDQADIILKNRFAFARFAWQPRLFNPDLEKWLHRARVPGLLIWGADDLLIPASYAAHWAQHLPDARTHVLQDCGHLPHVERAAETAELIETFVTQVSS